ncbi:hypothetical protein INT80_14550 [Gallibacterium anatis]|uniref:Uncharacterized protein n=1 Tax=Gallibacterium anatis TaxID=750 RepID=A0A930UYL6_9PAST|nr:hypothetical protein [Gallibacterium anatis]
MLLPSVCRGSEIYTSLEKGIIDAADFYFANNQAQGVHDIANILFIRVFISSPAVHMIMNLKTWQSLFLKISFLVSYFKGMALDTLIKAHYEDKIAYKEALDKARPSSGLESGRSCESFRAAAREIWQETAQQSEIGNRIIKPY